MHRLILETGKFSTTPSFLEGQRNCRRGCGELGGQPWCDCDRLSGGVIDSRAGQPLVVLKAIDHGLQFAVRAAFDQRLDRPLLALGQKQRLPLHLLPECLHLHPGLIQGEEQGNRGHPDDQGDD